LLYSAPTGAVLDFRILGPFEAVDHEPLSLGGHKQQAVLVILLLHRGEVVTADRLIEAVWDGDAPATASKTLQVYVSNLRKALGDGQLVTQGGGYLLQVGADQVDADRFATLAAKGRDALERAEPGQARTLLEAALALWRGPALADFAYRSFAQPEIARLEEAKLVALEDRIEADLQLGKHAALVPELEALVHEHPLRERLYEQLMVALYRSGRQVDALDRYQRARRELIEGFGIEPGPRLQEIQRAVLSHDGKLDLPAAPPGDERRFGGRRLIPPRPTRVKTLAAACALLILVVVLAASGGGGGGRRRAAAVGTPVISAPASGGVYAQGEQVSTVFSCPSAARGAVVVSCRDSNGSGTVSGGEGRLDTSRLGSHTYAVTVTLSNHARRTATITFAVVPLKVAIDRVHATVAGARTSVTLLCLGGGQGAACRGTLSLSRRGQLLASASYSVGAGAMRSIPLALTHAAVIALKRAKGHHLRVLAVATQPFAPPLHEPITLRRPG
jgi:DNA-binding SARP family transcriptional activator